MMSIVAKPLRYLIALERSPGEFVEVGYDAREPSGIIPVKYCNLRDEKNSGRFAPYYPPDDIDSEYSEPAPDPDYPGFWTNLTEQLDRAAEQGFHLVELDNLDTYDVPVSLQCFDRVADHQLEVLVKNPLLVEDGEQRALLAHNSAVLVIVEEYCGDPVRMDALRIAAGKPHMPVRFVSYGSIDNWANECAGSIRTRGFVDMGVTHSDTGEYASSRDVLLPTAPPLPPSNERPTVNITTTGDVLVLVNGQPVT